VALGQSRFEQVGKVTSELNFRSLSLRELYGRSHKMKVVKKWLEKLIKVDLQKYLGTSVN
jgi:hypothetical protein